MLSRIRSVCIERCCGVLPFSVLGRFFMEEETGTGGTDEVAVDPVEADEVEKVCSQAKAASLDLKER